MLKRYKTLLAIIGEPMCNEAATQNAAINIAKSNRDISDFIRKDKITNYRVVSAAFDVEFDYMGHHFYNWLIDE